MTIGTTGLVHRPVRAAVSAYARRSSGTSRIVLLTAVIGSLAALLGIALLPEAAPVVPPIALPWWLLAGLFYLAEAKVIHLHIGRSAHSFSMSEIPLVIGLCFFPPAEFVVARTIGAGLALLISRRQRPVKLCFNLAQFALGSVLAVLVVDLVAGGEHDMGPRLWAAVFAGTLVENVVGVLSVSTAISLTEGAVSYRRIPQMLGIGVIVSMTNTSLALMGITVFWTNPSAAWLFIVPTVTAAIAYRAYISERQQHEALEMLHESTLILQRTPDLDAALVSLLDHARKMFRASVAELYLVPQRPGEEVLRTRVGPSDGTETMVRVGAAFEDPLLIRAMADRRPCLVTGAGDGDPAAPIRRRCRNAMVAPLRGDSSLVGALVIADRLSDISTFGAEDLKLFETLANHTAVALENGQLEQSLAQLSRLKEELRHQAYHDALTGLANRSLFADVVGQRLDSAPDGLLPVVLFLDLDDFKLVNDSLGHTAGDELLIAVSHRITSCLRTVDVAARFGGDEFAVLLWDDPDLKASVAIANRLIAAFAPAFQLGERSAVVRTSIGVAAGHPGRETAGELLRNADVAMYSAKARGKGRVVVFEPSMHEAVVARARLSADLDKAVEAGELALQYQPIVAVDSGEMVGAEALVRWLHPERGLVGPDEFIRVAEDSGAILEVGRWVLTEACHQVRAWKERFPDRPFTMSVNISARQVAQPDFVDEVLRILGDAGVDPSWMVLEMTETAMLQESDATQQKMRELNGAGIGISVDDFGTGYSSLSYLQRFPVTTLKIARDFVDVEGTTDGWELASAIIALGRALNLMVIAEGVERRSQLGRLRALGCGFAQGFYFARPLDPTALEAMLDARDDLRERFEPPAGQPRAVSATVAEASAG